MRLIAAIALAAAAFGASGCGSDGPTVHIPPASLEELRAQVDEMLADLDSRECTALAAKADEFVATVDDLPESVGVEVKTKLREAGQNVADLAGEESQCSEPRSDTTTGGSGVVPSNSETVEPPATETPTAPTEPTTPPSGGTGGDTGGGSTGGSTGGDTGGGSTGGGNTGRREHGRRRHRRRLTRRRRDTSAMSRRARA